MRIAITIIILITGMASAEPTHYRNTNHLTLTWQPSAYTMAYQVWQDDTMVGTAYFHAYTVYLTFGNRSRIRVVPIGYDGVPYPAQASVWSDWYLYGLRIHRGSPGVVLSWPSDLGVVTVYRSTDMLSWEAVQSTADAQWVDYQALSYDKVFYKIGIQ